MSLRWVLAWIFVTVFAASAIGGPIDGGGFGRHPSAAAVLEDLRGKSITCRDRLGPSQALLHPDLIIESRQYGTRVVETSAISDNKIVRTVIYSEDGSLLGRVLITTVTYYDRTELRITTSGASIHDLRTTCRISDVPGLIG